jgi:hypothetical protein
VPLYPTKAYFAQYKFRAKLLIIFESNKKSGLFFAKKKKCYMEVAKSTPKKETKTQKGIIS